MTNHRVTKIEQQEQALELLAHTDKGSVTLLASQVILALPSRLIAQSIQFLPPLPNQTQEQLNSKATWMADQAKVIVTYDRPFWREKGLSGLAFAMNGILRELHDVSPNDASEGALFGFFAIDASKRKAIAPQALKSAIIKQLLRLYGQEADQVKDFVYQEWSKEELTATADDMEAMTAYPDYGPLALEGAWSDRLHIIGTETDRLAGGHLEGAIASAEKLVQQLV